MIPALIRKFVEAQERGDDHIVAWGDGSPTREFLYVADAAEGIVLATERYDASDAVNPSTGSGRRFAAPSLEYKRIVN